MKRKEFLKKTALASAILNGFSITSIFALSGRGGITNSSFEVNNLAAISEETKQDFINLLTWLRKSKWGEYITNITGIDISKDYTILLGDLIASIHRR